MQTRKHLFVEPHIKIPLVWKGAKALRQANQKKKKWEMDVGGHSHMTSDTSENSEEFKLRIR